MPTEPMECSRFQQVIPEPDNLHRSGRNGTDRLIGSSYFLPTPPPRTVRSDIAAIVQGSPMLRKIR